MIVIILLIIIISFYLYLYFRSSGTIENFYTFYLPFYKKEVSEKIVNMKQYHKPFFRNVFRNNIIKMGYIRNIKKSLKIILNYGIGLLKIPVIFGNQLLSFIKSHLQKIKIQN